MQWADVVRAVSFRADRRPDRERTRRGEAAPDLVAPRAVARSLKLLASSSECVSDKEGIAAHVGDQLGRSPTLSELLVLSVGILSSSSRQANRTIKLTTKS